MLPEERIMLPEERIMLPEERIMLPKNTIMLPEKTITLPEKMITLPENTIMLPTNTDGSGRKTRLCYRQTRTAVGRKHDYVTEKHGPQWAENTIMLPRNTDRSGLKSPAVEPAKHGRAGCLRGEAPVRPMRVAARVEIPSRRAGETRLSGVWKAPRLKSMLPDPDVYFSRTAGLNVLLYQVDLHVRCLRVILAWGGGVAGAGAACLGLWRRMSCFGLALDVGLPALLVRPTEHRAVSSLSHPSLNMSWSGCF